MSDRRKAFTLLELLIVVVIIGVLAAVALPQFFGAIRRGKESAAQSNLREIRRVQQAHESRTGNFQAVDQTNRIALTADITGDSNPDVEVAFHDPAYNYNCTPDPGECSAVAIEQDLNNYRINLRTGEIQEI